MRKPREILDGWLAAWREWRQAAIWPEDNVSGDQYVAELTGEHRVIPDAPPARPQQRPGGRHRRDGPPTQAIMTVSVSDLRYGPDPVWGQPSSVPPARTDAASLGDLVRMPAPPAPEAEEALAAPAGEGKRQGPPTVVMEVVRPNIAAEVDPYLASLPGYSDDPDAT